MRILAAAIAGSVTAATLTGGAHAAPPRPDKVVIVIEENHSFTQVIGSPQAPYMNQLAAQGALMTGMYGLTHPSQPNYLEFFAGHNQNVVDNTVPAPGSPFTTPNLGRSIIDAGFTFGGYSEDLPAVGSTIGQVLQYWRKHNPWVNWQAVSPPPAPGSNQLDPGVNMPFTSFPPAIGGDYSTLPTVSIVVPNQDHDMHDGTIQMADDWLVANIKPYVDWCVTHNSLFILTWDEDESASRNRIPTIFIGPAGLVKPGQYPQTWTLHHLQRTVADMYSAAPSGLANQCRAMVGPFTSDPAYSTVTFRQGVNGYTGCQDTYIEANAPASPHPTSTVGLVSASPLSQSLIRFDNIVGSGAGQVPAGATVLSAKLILFNTTDGSTNREGLYAMLSAWSDASTYASLVSGVSADGVEANLSPDYTVRPTTNTWAIFDVTASVSAWVSGAGVNNGWALLPGGTDLWRWYTSEAATVGDRPALEVSFIAPPAPCVGDINGDHQRNTSDLLLLLGAFGTCPADAGYNAGANLDLASPCINTADLVALLGVFGVPCP